MRPAFRQSKSPRPERATVDKTLASPLDLDNFIEIVNDLLAA
jgi:hypothetical protein